MTMTDLPTVNQELFAKVRDEIEAHPEAHNQNVWESSYAICGTTRCTAGWAMHFAHPEDKSIYDTIVRPEYVNLGFEGSGKEAARPHQRRGGIPVLRGQRRRPGNDPALRRQRTRGFHSSPGGLSG